MSKEIGLVRMLSSRSAIFRETDFVACNAAVQCAPRTEPCPLGQHSVLAQCWPGALARSLDEPWRIAQTRPANADTCPNRPWPHKPGKCYRLGSKGPQCSKKRPPYQSLAAEGRGELLPHSSWRRRLSVSLIDTEHLLSNMMDRDANRCLHQLIVSLNNSRRKKIPEDLIHDLAGVIFGRTSHLTSSQNGKSFLIVSSVLLLLVGVAEVSHF